MEIELDDYYNEILLETNEGRKILKAKYYGLMEEMLSVISYGEFSENTIDKMLLRDNLVESIVDYFREDSDEEAELMMKKCYEFIKKEFAE